ncbi:hypothetical protein [Mycobacterium sp.]|uniref:hypothetical protein n=1 Tax=Mycobacterium sp. TaxID=1785 RepID=UPI002C3FD24B|nr:hypothetical protein [Mycobacterium sp.]HTQ20882.1 hypothetical protein [Mycobacterium sp.]
MALVFGWRSVVVTGDSVALYGVVMIIFSNLGFDLHFSGAELLIRSPNSAAPFIVGGVRASQFRFHSIELVIRRPSSRQHFGGGPLGEFLDSAAQVVALRDKVVAGNPADRALRAIRAG